MNLVGSIVTNIGLALLSWVSILFIFATGNVMVVAYAVLLNPNFFVQAKKASTILEKETMKLWVSIQDYFHR